MELILQSDLQHQLLPVEAIANTFDKVSWFAPKRPYANPRIELPDGELRSNIYQIQRNSKYNVPANYITYWYEWPQNLCLDVRMETGTGKTYVYTRTIFELHKRYGINKFIIVVPTLPIKAGAHTFLEEKYVKQHFADVLGYKTEIELSVLEPQKQKKGRRFFPTAVRRFVSATAKNSNKISVLLINQALLTAPLLTRTDYDTGVADFFRPIDALRATNPFVIIDEPHRFKKAAKSYGVIVEQLQPQCILRFGATYPKVQVGKGKKKIERFDYGCLLYDLSAKDAFRQNLIKGVAKEHLEIENQRDEKVKILSTIKGESVSILHTTSNSKNTHVLMPEDSLGRISPEFAGLYITGITKDGIELSNGLFKEVGAEFAVDAYSSSYQEQMIRLALLRHFETERDNFRRGIKIKTLALFFIDSIQSFRGDNEGKNAWLRDMFDRLLEERLEIELQKDNTEEYEAYLLATKENIANSRAGYFAQDLNETDESIAKEVDDILHNKKELLSFKDENGNWNTRRFLFSKWTLREGWDNPNVFTIAKLRSSGSEISKLQEVGRGLRLPVDERGNRVCNDGFYLNYIVDFTEKQFANDLVAEINGQAEKPITHIPALAMIQVAEMLGKDEMMLMMELYQKQYILDIERKINQEKLFQMLDEYPAFTTVGFVENKVKDRNVAKPKPVKIRAAIYDELKVLWEELNKKYIIYFENEINSFLETELPKILSDGVFSAQVASSSRQNLAIKNGEATVVSEAAVQYEMHGRAMPYNEFLSRINRATSLPITILHNAIVEYSKYHPFSNGLISETSLSRFIAKFSEWKAANLQGRFLYKSTDFSKSATALTNPDGSAKREIAQGLIGIHLENGVPSEKYLYDTIAFDSPLERDNVVGSGDIESVVVYGKIPRSSISIPTIADSSYSPDFMYVVKKKNGEKILNIVIETKDVENLTELRGNEALKISCAEKFFNQLKIDGYQVQFHTQLNKKKMISIINEIMEKE